MTPSAAWVGQPLRRREDRHLVLGQGRFVEDITLPDMGWVGIVRSPLAHAGIGSVDLSEARAMPGVIACFSAADLTAEWSAPLPCVAEVNDAANLPPHWPLTADKARHVGDGVAVVVAETRALAMDAVELVRVDYTRLPAVTDVELAIDSRAPVIHEAFGTNRCYTWGLVTGDPDAAFARAEVTISERYRQQRLVINAMENRGALARPDGDGAFTLWSSTQIPHLLRRFFAEMLDIAEGRLRVVAPDVGGGFGAKVQVYGEEALCLALARRLDRPIKWVEARSEGFLSTHQARDMVQHIELAASADGRIEAIRVRVVAAMGAYLGLGTPSIPLLGAPLYTGCYDIASLDCEVVGAFTNTPMTDAYRGAGRPEATYAIERAIDALASRVGLDPVVVRRRNFHTSFPARMAGGHVIDSGDYNAAMDRALELVDIAKLRAEQEELHQSGSLRLLGIGVSAFLELAGLAPSRDLGNNRFQMGGWESGTVRVLPTGSIQVLTGLSPHGQGTATTLTQVVADQLGVDPEAIEIVHGDTAASALGMGTWGSRGIVVGGSAVHIAAQRVLDKARTIAAHTLGVPETELEFRSGVFAVPGRSRSMALREVAVAAWKAHDLPDGLEPGLEGHCVHDPVSYSWPSGAHIAIVEVDVETGAVKLRRYVAVDDAGVVVNPLLAHGQIHGALAQGIAQALWEEAVFDDDGNLVTDSLMSYYMPTAVEFPFFELDSTCTPSPTNPLGAKGIGETGTIGAPPAVVNAVLDALAPLGVTHLDMPMTPERIWRAIKKQAHR